MERLLAHEEIRQLAARYAVAVDRRDLDALVALFVDDVQVGAEGRGHDALRASFDRSLRQVGVTILNVGTQVIDLVDADHAQGTVYCRGEVQVGERWIAQAIVYVDTYQRRHGHWYFARRRHLLFYGADQPVNPMTLPPANWPANHTGRGEVPECFESWERFWQRVGDGGA